MAPNGSYVVRSAVQRMKLCYRSLSHPARPICMMRVRRYKSVKVRAPMHLFRGINVINRDPAPCRQISGQRRAQQRIPPSMSMLMSYRYPSRRNIGPPGSESQVALKEKRDSYIRSLFRPHHTGHEAACARHTQESTPRTYMDRNGPCKKEPLARLFCG